MLQSGRLPHHQSSSSASALATNSLMPAAKLGKQRGNPPWNIPCHGFNVLSLSAALAYPYPAGQRVATSGSPSPTLIQFFRTGSQVEYMMYIVVMSLPQIGQTRNNSAVFRSRVCRKQNAKKRRNTCFVLVKANRVRPFELGPGCSCLADRQPHWPRKRK